MLGLGLSIPEIALRGVSREWTPFNLGEKLLAWWDAEDATSMNLSGSSVGSWTDRKNSITVTQATSGFKPVYSSTSFNNRPGLTFDGTDDCLVLASQPLPTGSTPVELWVLASQLVPPGTTGTRIAFYYGTTANGLGARYIRRTVVTGVNRASQAVGYGTAQNILQDASVDLSGIHVIRGETTTTQNRISVDGNTKVTGSVVPAISASSAALAIGANGTGASGYWNGVMNSVIVTGALTDEQATLMMALLKQRGGVA